MSQLIANRWTDTVAFALIFGRASGLIVSAPFWGSRMVPLVVRIWVAVLLAVATFPLVSTISLPANFSILSLLMALAGEIFLGVTIGWLAQMIFAGMRLAGQEIEIRSGLGLMQLIDPHEGGQSGFFSAFLEIMVGLVFFSLNGHHLLIQALSSSYNVFPLGGEKFVARVTEGVISSTGEIFVIALRVAAPVLVGLLLSDIVLGVLSRAIPQMNVFLVAQPLQFGFGMLLLMLSIPALVWFFVNRMPQMIGVPGGIG